LEAVPQEILLTTPAPSLEIIKLLVSTQTKFLPAIFKTDAF
jgi:hypothetical protein